ncbi:O-antigen ligase [Melghirimyces profundicolus]|uniref:O-antigen ligase n=1 Tax=Melghirimyces profundicolus TaxID=1242148 RepID=A0A2T6BCC9_9BACL|nr:O-antigen ligase [Melghirimyces profundicolus]PTX53731.1 O-antigen ligase [Melghirimyces profundicolus]
MRIKVKSFSISLEKTIIIFILFLETGALLPLLRLKGLLPQRLDDVLSIGINGIIALLLLFKFPYIIRIKKNLSILLLTFLAFISIIWSVDWATTLIRSLKLFLITAFGIYISSRYKLDDFLRFLAWTFGLVIFLSLIFGSLFPAYGMNQGLHEGAWQGVFDHKNGLGRMMTLSATLFLVICFRVNQKRLIYFSGFVLSTLLIWLSTSKTALVIFLTLLVVFSLIFLLRTQYKLLISLLIMVLLLGGGVLTWFLSYAELVASYLGRDLTLTGRTALWEAVYMMIEQRPFFGYGYNAFWTGWSGPSAYVWEIVRWEAPHSHNGLFDLWLNLGLVGVTIFILGFIRNYFHVAKYFRYVSKDESMWPLMFFSFFVLSNITESQLLGANFLWLVYVVISNSMLKNKKLIEKNVVEAKIL